MDKPRILFDHDGRHPLIYMYEPPIQREELEAAVDELVGTPVEALMLTLGDCRTLLCDLQAGQLWGDQIDKWPHIIWRRANQNLKHLLANGEDPLLVLCQRAHAKGMQLYATLLVQQGPRERMLKSWENADFAPDDWQQALQPLEIGAKGDVDADWPGYRCLDFAQQEIRQQTLAVIAEVLERYPVDGFELQLNYTPYYFHPNETEAGIHSMNEWIGQVYETVKKSGSQRELVLHVPADINGGLAVGLDPLAWIRQGTVDALIAEASSDADPSADFSPFVAAAKNTPSRIIAAVQSRVDSDRISDATIEMVRAMACNFWAQGIDGLYLSNWLMHWPYKADFYEKLREIADPQIMAPKDKFYRIPTQTQAPAKPLLPPHTANQLPVDLEEGQSLQLKFALSDDLHHWDRVGRVHQVLLRLRIAQATELDQYEFALNNKPLPEHLLRRLNQMYIMKAPRYRVTGYWFIFRLDREHWPIQGENTLTLTLVQRDPGVIPQASVRDLEVETKYLMGKNFHRDFVDEDLGAYEMRV